MLISEIKNDLPTIKPVKEIMSIYIEGINPNIPNRNGFIYALIGSPGSGKSSIKNLNIYIIYIYEKTEFTAEQELQILMLVPNFTNQLLGIDYLINRFKLRDDTYLQPVYQEIANNIQSPLTEWNERFNNN